MFFFYTICREIITSPCPNASGNNGKNIMAMATLYKTNVPTDFETGEYYQPSLTVERVGGDYRYFVREKHGWFSAKEKRIVHAIHTLAPEDGFANIDDAMELYNRQIRHRASEGFRHQFEFDPMAESLKYTDLG